MKYLAGIIIVILMIVFYIKIFPFLMHSKKIEWDYLEGFDDPNAIKLTSDAKDSGIKIILEGANK